MLVEKPPMASKVEIWPTRPEVPIPDPRGVFSILKATVASGPKIIDARVGGSQIFGFLTMLGIWSIEVPKPWAKSP